MAIERTVITRPGFVADHESIVRSTGRQIDWANVPNDFKDSITGKKHIPAGTAMSKNLANDMIVPRTGLNVDPAADPPGNAALKTYQVLTTSAEEGRTGEQGPRFVAETGYGTLLGGVLYEKLMPGYGDPDWAAQKAELITAGFKFEKYANSIAS